MPQQPHGGGEWHPGLNGHRLRGLLLAWDYLQLLSKALKAIQASPAAASAAAARSVAVKPLPAPRGCDKSVCGVAPKCATSFEPRQSGDLRKLLAPGSGKWKVTMCQDSVNMNREQNLQRHMGYVDMVSRA